MLALGSSVPSELTAEGDDLYWLRLRPEQGGRYSLYRRKRDGLVTEVLGREFNVRTRVHEYGGGSYRAYGSTVFFSNFKDQRVYCKESRASPRPITEEGLRYADYVVDERRRRLIGVSEDHRAPAGLPTNTLASINLDGTPSRTLVQGNDFYSSPRLDPQGSMLAWLTWNFPNMPWDGTELWVAKIGRDGALRSRRRVAGGKAESIFQPVWSPEGRLYFISDRSGWWNLYRWVDGNVEAVHAKKADFGRPQWSLRLSTYAFQSEERINCTYAQNGIWHLAALDTGTGALAPIKVPFTEMGHIGVRSGRAVFLGGSPAEPMSVVELDPFGRTWKVLYRPDVPKPGPGNLSTPTHISFPTSGRRKAYAFFYGPTNSDYSAPRGERPPLMVVSHGGPTSATTTLLNPEIQAWTSRGFAVADVNYGGSTGYGREYRRRLNGQWGIVDVDDCVNAASYLARTGKVDGKRLVIRGGSAGGYTTLCALTFRNVFRAGASYFGVGDVEGLAKDTHKFESRYLDSLIGPYPDRKDIYRERSPIHHVDRLSCPVIFFQGLEDAVVPPKQAEAMVESLRNRGVPVAYIPFEGEQHGFRKAGTIKRAFRAELYFYSKVLGFKPADEVEPVEIQNLT
jgi:dipeptidyl aminopeptidase/acylaminoacyl peptidase